MPARPRSEVSFVTTKLPCPIYAADFDPYNRGYLVVGGGGGESKSGVPNQISVLDVSNRATISTVVDIELTRDEDNVQSLATLSTKDGLIVLAGINSSEADQNAGKNEHFRSFQVKCPPRKKQKTDDASPDAKGDWKLIGKRSLFQTSTAAKKETYQRLLRLSPSRKKETGSSRIGAIATGSGNPSEIVVFNATTPTPERSDILNRIELPENTEVRDLDISEAEEALFSLVYCTEHDLCEQTYGYDFKNKKTQKTPNGPRRVYQIPFPDVMENPKSRPKLRCVRFLNTQNVVVALNKPDRSGAELRIYHLYPSGPAILAQQTTLPRHVKQVVSMDICALDADESGDQQIIVAVAAQDISIEIYTTNFQRKTETFSSLRSYLGLRDLHEVQMTKICFSTFHAAPPAATSEKAAADGEEKSDAASPPNPKFVRLASTSMGNTIAVEAFPVRPLTSKSKSSRYVLSHPNDEALSRWTHIIVISMVGLCLAYFLQAFLLGKDAAKVNLLTGEFHGFGHRPPHEIELIHEIKDAAPVVAPASTRTAQPSRDKERLHSLLSAHSVEHPTEVESSSAAQQTALVLRPNAAASAGIALDVHPDKETLLEEDGHAKHWHELEEHQKSWWKEKLKHAGHWAEGEGEAVFQGILFSEYAGMIGQAAADVLREL